MTPEQEQRIRVLWEETPRTWKQIGAEYGIPPSTLAYLAKCRGWVSFNPPSAPRKRASEQEERIRFLWEETPQTAVQIAAAFGLTKNAIIGVASRRKWISFNEPGHVPKLELEHSRAPWPYERTMQGRLDALNARLDRVLAETEPAIRSGRAADAATLRAGEQGRPVGW